jgi:HK97 family phage prohead protease
MKIKGSQSVVRKEYTAPVQIGGDRQVKFIFSTEAVDRDFDVIKQTGIDTTYYLTNPVIFFNHDHELPIGKCVSIGIENGNLAGVVEFVPADNPAIGAKSEGIYQLCRDGFLNTTSIGFIPITIERPEDARNLADGVDVITCEIVEISIVGIPANREALIQAISPPTIQIEQPILLVEPVKTFRSARLKRVLASLA